MLSQPHRLVGDVSVFLLRGFEFSDGIFESVVTMRPRLFDLALDLKPSAFQFRQFFRQA